MTKSTVTIPELSRRVAALIEKTFSAADALRIRGMIREFHWAPEPLIDERIHLDILEICDGKMERARELVELAKIDWRDLIMMAEYDVVDGKIIPNARCQTRLAEIAMRKRKRAADGE
jgi:hypothetical protein